MKVMLYPFEDVDIWCFAKEDQLARIEAYLKCHDPNLHYTGVFDRMIYEKIKFYPAAKTKRGELLLMHRMEKVNTCFKKMSIIIFYFCADRMK